MMAKCYLANSLLPNLFNVITNTDIRIKKSARCSRCHEARLDATEPVHQLQNEVHISYVRICVWPSADKSLSLLLSALHTCTQLPTLMVEHTAP